MEEDTLFKSMIGEFDNGDVNKFQQIPQFTMGQNFDPIPVNGNSDHWSNQYLKKSPGDILTAVPPNFIDGKATNVQNSLIASRLRAASDMHQQGMISGVEKDLMKSLILARDTNFRQVFAQAEKAGDWGKVREYIRKTKLENPAPHAPNAHPADALNDFVDFNVTDLPEDLSAAFDSAFADVDLLDPAIYSNPTNNLRKNSLQSLLITRRISEDIKPSASTLQQTGRRFSNINNKGFQQFFANNAMPMQKGIQGNPINPVAYQIPKQMPAPSQQHQTYQRMAQQRPSKLRPTNSRTSKALPSPLHMSVINGNQRGSTKSRSSTSSNPDLAKQRKNERERKRRLAVSQGFDNLLKMLHMPETARVDKATILQNAIQRIQALEQRYDELYAANESLRSVQL